MDSLVRPLFPAYLRIRDLTLCNELEPIFSLRIGNSSRELTLSADVLCVLALADGHSTLDDIYVAVRTLNSSLTREAFDELVSTLYSERLLVSHDTFSKGLSTLSAARYSRHLLFFSMLGHEPSEVQAKLASSCVVILGVGGIGTWLAYLLTAAGVKRVHLVDGDVVEESNLTRQVLYEHDDVGKRKVEIAQRRLHGLNPDVECTTSATCVDGPQAIESALSGLQADLLLLSADRPEQMAAWTNDYALRTGTPWSLAGYSDDIGLIGPLFVPGLTGCLRCQTKDSSPHDRYLSMPLIGDINRRFQVPSFGPLNGVVASIQAKEAIAFLSEMPGFMSSLGTRLTVDISTLSVGQFPWPRDEECDACRTPRC